MPPFVFIPLVLLYSALLPINEEVLLLLTLGTMVYTLYNRLPELIAPYFDGQNADLLRTYRHALEFQSSQLLEAHTLFQSEIALLEQLDAYVDWSLLRLNLLLQLRQERGAALLSLELDSMLFSLDQDRKTLAGGALELSRFLWTSFVTVRLSNLEQQLSTPTLLVSRATPVYPFLKQLRLFSLVRGSR